MKLMVKVTMILAVVILFILIPSVTLMWENQQKTIEEQARIRALSIYEMILITRQWVAENRDRIQPVPAVATKELAQYANNMASFKFHITSDKLINPENAPDNFEQEAIAKMKKDNVTEYSKIERNQGDHRTYRYAAPLLINQSCLKCHSHQDYRINDFRGLLSISLPMDELETSIIRNGKITFYTVIIVLLFIMIIVCLLVYYLITRHLTTLTKATKDIRQGNRISTNLKTDDEIQELSEAFDQMSKQLADNEEILKAKLDEAVSKYAELVNELKSKNKTLGSLNQLKTDLLDSIAHEIRTPLTKILSYSELLGDTRVLVNEEIREKFTKSMKNNINAIKTMFNDIITLSRLEHEQYDYHKIPLNLYEMVVQLKENYEIEIKAKNLDFQVDIGKDDIVYVDGETFSSAITNIISNSVKYAQQNGNIAFSAKTDGDNYIIICRDTGVGIPSEELPKIVNRFQRGSNVKKEFSGTGLGLSIVSRIIKAHEGKLTIESELGMWTQITLTFRLKNIKHI